LHKVVHEGKLALPSMEVNFRDELVCVCFFFLFLRWGDR
jgi:hypothetical protein